MATCQNYPVHRAFLQPTPYLTRQEPASKLFRVRFGRMTQKTEVSQPPLQRFSSSLTHNTQQIDHHSQHPQFLGCHSKAMISLP